MHVAGSLVPIIVEGPSDKRLLASMLDEGAASVIHAGTRSTALGVIRILSEDEEQDRMVGSLIVLVDRDFDLSPGRQGRLLCTTASDLDAELITVAGVLERVVRTAHRLTTGVEVASQLNRISEAVHRFRAARQVARDLGLGPEFSRLNGLLRERSECPAEEIADALGIQECDWGPFVDSIRGFLESEPDLAKCRGHDLHLVVSWGTKKGRDGIQDLFMAAVDVDAFLSTPTGSALEVWASKFGVRIWQSSRAA